jgi:hypothetical protein
MQNSGKPEFCRHPSKRSTSFEKMDCRVISAFTRVFRRAMPGNDGGECLRPLVLKEARRLWAGAP